MDLQLRGRRALVTGGTKGIGRAIVEAFAAEGADVAFCARTEADVTATAKAVGELGVRTFGRALDVADGPALKAWVVDAAEELGGLDAVVANVSALSIGPDEENWKAEFEVDLMHSVRVVDAAMPYLERSDAASITTISSVSGREIDIVAGPYGVMKGAVVHYAQGLAYHLAPKGIRANTVSPGNTYFEGGFWHNIEHNNPDLYNQVLAMNPTGRMGTPEEVAAAVVFLASPLASRISGTNLIVDGALTKGVQL
ncbi:MAG: 3-oxoacyl-[acyl-carrier protein] reductase [Actinomycetota bacterium]|jgi:NAD(P)-dependent dehydrogenase (short-subunit alcohol dehydrogenase family)|nr:3-oxoacyl-[acyl-carrier protein] reductase [Actinomycetota bacterium]MDQ1504077.1 3-oxoacyl-[acyl-carrier protein] reductase [Actinomycetota bacterium]